MMADRGILAPALLILTAGVLGGIIALELGQRMPDSDAMVPATATRPAAPTAPAPASLLDADGAAGRVTAVLARPLFSPGRRPAAQAAAGPAGTAALPRMSAVIVTPEGRRAIFASGADSFVVVSEGGRVGAYDVRSIEVGRVTLAGPDGTRVVTPEFSKLPPRAAGPAPSLPSLPGLPGLQGLAGLPGMDGPPPPPAVPGAGLLR